MYIWTALEIRLTGNKSKTVSGLLLICINTSYFACAAMLRYIPLLLQRGGNLPFNSSSQRKRKKAEKGRYTKKSLRTNNCTQLLFSVPDNVSRDLVFPDLIFLLLTWFVNRVSFYSKVGFEFIHLQICQLEKRSSKFSMEWH